MRMRMTPQPPSIAIILTHNRPELLDRCVAAAAGQVNGLIVIDNASDPPVVDEVLFKTAVVDLDKWPRVFIVHRDETQPANLSRLWNIGLTAVGRWFDEDPAWNVVLLCDDAILPDGWVATVATGMRAHNAAAASTHQATPVSAPIFKTEPDSDLWNRMCPWAFMLAGEKCLRADERLHWWWCDTHMDWQARKNGGMVILPGPVVANERPNDFLTSKPELAARAGVDGEIFAEIWGFRPW